MGEFDGLVAVVTGGASGIGAAAAHQFAARDARAAVIDRDRSEDTAVALSVQADVTSTDSVDKAVAEIVAELGAVDVLVNNAGIGAVGDVSANPDEEWRRVFDVNVLGAARVSRACLEPLRRSSHAAIVNTCSMVALIGVPERALYSASKGAVAALTLAMAADHVRDGIRVNAVLPGTADTPWVGRLLDRAEDPEATAAALRARQPIGRLVSADEVAAAICYLASPAAASTTGVLLPVDGGMTGIRLPS